MYTLTIWIKVNDNTVDLVLVQDLKLTQFVGKKGKILSVTVQVYYILYIIVLDV